MASVKIICFFFAIIIVIANGQPILKHSVLKRSFNPYDFPAWNGGDVANFGSPTLQLGPWASSQRSYAPSTMEVATAIAAAKQASANILIAQQQVQAAKDNVFHQQRIATEKETHATLLTQKSEAAAAIQRSEAAAAAQSVILAQQRLAAAKNAVAQQQRIASAKEAQAAAALQSSAHAAAAEIQRTENEAARLATIQRSGTAAAAHHVSATKDAIIGPLNAGNNHVENIQLPLHHPHYAIAPWNAFAPAISSYHQPQFGGGAAAGISGWPTAPSSSLYVSPSAVKPAFNVWG